MKAMYRIIALLILSWSLIACGPQKVGSDEDANAMAEKFVRAVHTANYDEAFSLVSDEFYAPRPRDKWIAYYKAIDEVMGPVVSVKLVRKHEDDRFSGRFYVYEFSIKHENGFTKDMITFVQKINTEAPLQVLAHKIDSSKLAKVNSMY